MKSEKTQLLLLMIVNSILLVGAYFFVAPYFPIYCIYLAVGAVMGLVFVIYNRGFVGKNITPDQLPESMSPVEKQRFMDESRERLHRSRWMLTIIFPIILAFALDMMYLFLLPMLEQMFS
jgi:hypothetical protein